MIEIKHDTAHAKWKRLSPRAHVPQGLVADLVAHVVQFARDHQMNGELISGRVVEVDREDPKKIIRVVHQRDSDALVNKPAKTVSKEGFHALDSWAKVYPAPTSIPFELKPTGGVFRGMANLEGATAYAEQVADFFAAHGVDKQVFVVAGPTSTTKSPFEVVDASAGYSILHRTARRMAADDGEAGVVVAERARG